MVTAANARTLEHARYHIRTDMGLSDESYNHLMQSPIYGTGQGSGNSPAIWCFISSLLYDCYDKKAAKAMYITPDPIDPKQSNLVWSDSLMIRMGRQIYLLAKNRIAHNNKF